MKIRKTSLTCLSILVTALLSFFLARNISMLSTGIGKVTDLNTGFELGKLITHLVIAATFCFSAWLMLVWDAGDKIPPIIMLLIGIVGLVLYFLVAIMELQWHSAYWVTLFAEAHAYTLSALFVAFAISGLFTNRNPR